MKNLPEIYLIDPVFLPACFSVHNFSMYFPLLSTSQPNDPNYFHNRSIAAIGFRYSNEHLSDINDIKYM